jgi:hypothetical protein
MSFGLGRDTAYLAGKDDNLFDGSCSLFLQELADDVVSERAGPDDGEVPVSRHVLNEVYGSIPYLYHPLFMRFLVWAAHPFQPHAYQDLTKPLAEARAACPKRET